MDKQEAIKIRTFLWIIYLLLSFILLMLIIQGGFFL
ncbi:MAG: hypothetical protein [Siphoviridae sp. ctjeG17]|nr:MAG: hypothetical protein [Siphoviridae sp. ctjeG17]